MGREIMRVPRDFDAPLNQSYADAVAARHAATCSRASHDACKLVIDPPEGDGWQLWETVAFGPVTPVFATADELIGFMCQPVPVEQRTPWRPEAYPRLPWGQGWRREIAEPFVRTHGEAPSVVLANGVLTTGPEDVVSR